MYFYTDICMILSITSFLANFCNHFGLHLNNPQDVVKSDADIFSQDLFWSISISSNTSSKQNLIICKNLICNF